ncbi:MAG: hypothetical protein B6241_14320 [Spirochaetaceae bacterium 4572_59]|nr:MAG: hypothetical protein B6241_14320 [Spirochaetaceae bacterium 4572_59]
MLHLAHISDTHVSELGKSVDGLNTRKKFRDTLEVLKKRSPDGIILTGDLAQPQGSATVYKWMKERLDALEIPYIITPGNHDNSSLLIETFNLKNEAPHVILTGLVVMKGEPLLFLESAEEKLKENQSKWLLQEMKGQTQKCILFMHHPPCVCNVPFMDNNYPYKTPEFFQKTVKESGKDLTIFCGHYHVEKELTEQSVPMKVYITPPTLGCLDPDCDEYQISDPRTGWREIHIEKHQVLETSCYYLEDL